MLAAAVLALVVSAAFAQEEDVGANVCMLLTAVLICR